MLIRAALFVMLLATVAGAQEPEPTMSQRPPSPLPPALSIVADTTLLPFERPNGALLRAGTTTYDLTSANAGALTSLGVRTIQVMESSVAGTPAWLVTESRTGSAVETTDSLFLTRTELAPIRWSATSGRAALGASFTRDTMFGALQSYQGRSSFTLGIGAGAFVTPGMMERIVELLPLSAGYRALATVVVVEMGTPHTQPATLTVERDEALAMGDHTVDCWVVLVRAGLSEQRMWVSKETPRVIQTVQSFATGTLTAIVRQ